MVNLIFIASGNNEKKKVLITGITGQDGSYLAEFLLKRWKRIRSSQADREF